MLARLLLPMLSLLVTLPACGEDDLPPPAVEVGGDEGPAGITQVEWGAILFADQGCPACHGVAGDVSIGGPLNRIWGLTRELDDGGSVVVDEAYLRRSILDPDAEVVAGYEPSMPSYRGLLTEPEVDALVVFLKQLR